MSPLKTIAAHLTAVPSRRHQRPGTSLMLSVAVLLACAPAARAVVAPPATRSAPVLTGGGSSLGTAEFETALDDASATAIMSTSALKLRRGGTFQIHSCVWYKAAAVAPQSVCKSNQVTVGFATALRGVAAPQAQLQIQRPAAGQPAGTVAGTVLIDELGAGQSSSLASSWPRAGMRVGGVAVPAVGQATGEVLESQGISLDGVRPGGINTFAQDSICRAKEIPAGSPARGSADALGILPFAYEIQEPVGKPRGTILILHGGAWVVIGRGAVETNRGEADRWLSRGWRTVNASYRACSSSSDDVTTLFDRVQQVYGDSRPICASGQSAGAHLALVLAAARPQLACAVAQAGPADLAALADQTTTDPSGLVSHHGPRRVSNMAIAAFGNDRLAALSPTRQPVRARVLFAIGASDTLIAWEQATHFAAAQNARDHDAYVDTLRLSNGPIPWIHGLVSQDALNDLNTHEKTLVAPLTTTTLTAPRSVHSTALKTRGLPVKYSCSSACNISVRLRRGAHSIARAHVRRATFGPGQLTVRLSAQERTQLKQGKIKLTATVRADGARKHLRRSVTIR